ncbi:hypothetical protein MW887_004286 [Aspergillus wentii]|nr:hypothetical protein MW887_004286 [Aspergillus wentii]
MSKQSRFKSLHRLSSSQNGRNADVDSGDTSTSSSFLQVPVVKISKRNRLKGLFGLSRTNSQGGKADVAKSDCPTEDEDEDGIKPEDEAMKDLWGKAYKKLCEEDASLVEAYRKYLIEQTDKETGGVFWKKSKPRAMQWTPWRSVVGESAIRIVHGIMTAKDVISAAVSAEPHASLAWAGVAMILPLLVKPVTQGEDAVAGLEFVSDLLVRYRLIEESVALKMDMNLTSSSLVVSISEKTVSLYMHVLRYQMRLARQYSHSAVFRYIRNVGGIDDWKEMIATIRDIDSIIKDKLSAVSNDTVQDIKHAVSKLHEKMNSSLLLAAETRDDVHRNERLLDSLPRVARAAYGFDHQDHGSRCLQGTQVDILKKIQDWTNDPSGKPILWLQGMAGTGKSTIARTVAAAFYHGYGLSKKELLPDEACLGGSFFFNHQDVNCRNPQKVFPTLVRDLIQVLPEMRDLVCDTIASHHDIHEQPLRRQWLHLVLNPLQTLSNKLDSPVTVVFVLDALDECEDSERIGKILGLFGQARNLEPLQVRVLATSRPERELFQNVKSGLDIRDEVLYKIRSSDGTEARKDDITRFVEHELENIRAKHDQHQSWPGDESIQRLVEKADGLFIYAATACRFLLKATKRTVNNRLKVILESRPNTGRIGSNPQYSLDEMYTRILEIILTGDSDNDEDMSALFKAVAGSIVILSKRLAVHTLSNLIGIAHGDVEWMIEHLLSVLEVPANKQEPVQLLHLSFRDFLIDPQRCQNSLFQIDEKQANHRVMVYSLRVMSASLKRDICGLKKPGTNIKDIEPVVLE